MHRTEMYVDIAFYSDIFGAERHFVTNFSTRDIGAVVLSPRGDLNDVDSQETNQHRFLSYRIS